MTENQNDQTVKNNQDGNQSKENNNGQKNNIIPTEKTAVKEDEKVKPIPAEENKEQEPMKHPHEVSIPVSTNNVNKSSL